MNKNFKFSYQLVGVVSGNFNFNNEPLEELRNRKEEIQIKVENLDDQNCYIWSTDKFQNNLLTMRDIVNTYTETGEIPELDPDEDPFHD